jgi:uncharacterized damage-inducible protein DinB
MRTLTPEELALEAKPNEWPVWAILAHMAGTRVYWLCGVLQEPGAETTPFPNASDGEGWEDHLEQPRRADELLTAMESSWRIIEECLERWTLPMLDDEFERRLNGRIQRHTRRSVIYRMATHDAYHTGEVSLLLGQHGRQPMDPWDPALD